MASTGSLIERLYAAAAGAGLLKTCSWTPSGEPTDTAQVQTQPVGWTAPDQDVLSGVASSTEYAMTYPKSCFVGLCSGEQVEVEGVRYQVREVQALGDGSEVRARLMRVT